MSKIIHCSTSHGYDIVVEAGVLARTGELVRAVSEAGLAVVVADSNVAPLYAKIVRGSLSAAGFDTRLFVFPAGESSKTHETLLKLYRFLAQNGVTRSDLIVALGGGVTGDTAGFAAATYMRGVNFVQIPTSLLAQIDSSVGGKTGVDLPEGKNLVGAFHQPRLVICDPETLRTLSGRFFTDGMAEAVKYGCILDASLFGLIEDGGGRTRIAELIERCIALKRDVVEHDEFESGERMLLNFGHTMGHAIEKFYQFKTYSHGEAVSMGMMLAASAGERHGLTAPGTAKRLGGLLDRLGLPLQCDAGLKTLAQLALRDKKRKGREMNVVLLREIGNGFLHRLPASELETFFAAAEPAGK